MSMSNDTTINPADIDSRFAGRVRIHPNGTNTVYVDAQQNSGNGDDAHDRTMFLRFRNCDLVCSGNWTRGEDGTWTPDEWASKITRRASFGMARSPKTYVAPVLAMLAEMLTQWYDNTNGGAAMRASEVEQATRSAEMAADKVVEARAVYEAAIEAQRVAEARLTAAQLATVTLHAPSAS